MSDLIKRSDAIKALDNAWINGTSLLDANEAIKQLNDLPPADRPQEEWIDKGDYAECSNCGVHSGTQFDGVEPIPLKTNFCPNCGARMKIKL